MTKRGKNGKAKGKKAPAKNGRKKPPANGDRDEKGHFLVGNPGGPGRTKGQVDFVTAVKQRAKVEGLTVEEMMGNVGWGLYQEAKDGDAACAKVLLDRVLGPIDKGLEVNVDARSVHVGPPMPDDNRDLASYLTQIAEAGASQGLSRNGDPDADAEA